MRISEMYVKSDARFRRRRNDDDDGLQLSPASGAARRPKRDEGKRAAREMRAKINGEGCTGKNHSLE